MTSRRPAHVDTRVSRGAPRNGLRSPTCRCDPRIARKRGERPLIRWADRLDPPTPARELVIAGKPLWPGSCDAWCRGAYAEHQDHHRAPCSNWPCVGMRGRRTTSGDRGDHGVGRLQHLDRERRRAGRDQMGGDPEAEAARPVVAEPRPARCRPFRSSTSGKRTSRPKAPSTAPPRRTGDPRQPSCRHLLRREAGIPAGGRIHRRLEVERVRRQGEGRLSGSVRPAEQRLRARVLELHDRADHGRARQRRRALQGGGVPPRRECRLLHRHHPARVDRVGGAQP